MKHHTLTINSGLVAALAFGAWSSDLAQAAQAGKAPPPATHMDHMDHITTQAQAEALKPGDSMAMTCSKCKHVMVQKVTAGKAHVKMMTVGQKFTCASCGGSVEVVATGKGKGKDAEVTHVCSKCGEGAMFCAATRHGESAMKDMPDMKEIEGLKQIKREKK